MSTPAPRRTPRADAARNRDRLLATARSLFAEHGSGVQLPEIARVAGVGIGTVYRHFPTHADLVEAAAAQRFAEIENFARHECLSDTGQVPALTRYLRHVGEILASDRGLSAAIESTRSSTSSEPRGEARSRLESTIGEIIEADRGAGTLRADCTVTDIYMIVGALSATIRTENGDWRRLLTVILDGLRP